MDDRAAGATADPAQVWDPFEGSREVSSSKASKFDVVGLGRAARWAGAAAIALLSGWLFVSGWFEKPFYAAAFLWVVLAGAKPAWRRSTELARAAVDRRWIYAGEIGERRMKAIAGGVPEFFEARIGLSPLSLREEAYGRMRDGRTFWFATDSSGADHNPNRARGDYALLLGLRLERDVGFRAAILPERNALARLARPGVQTESVVFGDTFEIRTGPGRETERLALLRALTPATQTTLLDLAARFRIGLVVDGGIVFVGGFVSLDDADAGNFGDDLAGAISEFAAAAEFLTTYIE